MGLLVKQYQLLQKLETGGDPVFLAEVKDLASDFGDYIQRMLAHYSALAIFQLATELEHSGYQLVDHNNEGVQPSHGHHFLQMASLGETGTQEEPLKHPEISDFSFPKSPKFDQYQTDPSNKLISREYNT
ncbi:UNVERIFIED_CONTAM: hypothetical protein Sradi_6441300 [Sesamum radiatum]|uniref:Uncharacterized protein n=1 Tax=Sesamum radiatum TaxID=300843 RepID=A0AAW2K7C8_SESRA